MSLGWKTSDQPPASSDRPVRSVQRTSWVANVGLGVEHLLIALVSVAVFATFMRIDLSVALLMTGVATVLFLLVVRNKVPGYLGLSAAFVPAVLAIRATGAQTPEVMGALFVVGVAVLFIGLLARIAGGQIISYFLPPPLAGAILVLIGLNLAPTVVSQYWAADHWVALITAAAVVMIFGLSGGFLSRIALPVGAAVGLLASWMFDQQGPIFSVVPGQNLQTAQGQQCLVENLTCQPVAFSHERIDFSGLAQGAPWAVPGLESPVFTTTAIMIALPFIFALLAETTTHVKTVGQLLDQRASTGSTTVYRPRRRRSQPLIPSLGRASIGVGLAAVVSTAVGASPSSADSAHVRAMASSRVLATAPLYCAAIAAVVLAFFPDMIALLSSIPPGVIGGVSLVMCGLIALLGARMWVDNRVDFSLPTTTVPLAVGLVIGVGDLHLPVADMFPITGMGLAIVVMVVFYHLLNLFTPGDVSPTHVEENPIDWQDTSPVSLIDLRQYALGQAGAPGYHTPTGNNFPPYSAGQQAGRGAASLGGSAPSYGAGEGPLGFPAPHPSGPSPAGSPTASPAVHMPGVPAHLAGGNLPSGGSAEGTNKSPQDRQNTSPQSAGQQGAGANSPAAWPRQNNF